MKLVKGDEVQVLIGKDKGKRGKVEKAFPKEGKVLVSGVNIYKKHLKPAGQNQPGGIIDKSFPLPLGKIALVCPHCGKLTRVGFQIKSGGARGGEAPAKIRICRKCKGAI